MTAIKVHEQGIAIYKLMPPEVLQKLAWIIFHGHGSESNR
jgi:hypothetical protein